MDEHYFNYGAVQQTAAPDSIQRNAETHDSTSLPANMTKTLPDSPRTTFSAILGAAGVSALEQGSVSRAEAQNFHAEADSKNSNHNDETTPAKQSNIKSKSSFYIKKALKTLTPTRKKSKSLSGAKTKEYPVIKHTTHDDCRGTDNEQSIPALPTADVWSTYGIRHPAQYGKHSSPRTPHQVYAQVEGNETQHPPSSVYQTPRQSSQPAPHHSSMAEDYSITIGGQLPDPRSDALPAIFLTPTNSNTYAIAGRSRVVAAEPIKSHHAAVHNAAYESIFATTPVVKFADDVDQDDVAEPTMRGSAVPPPLSIKKSDVGPGLGKLPDEFVVAAFDGVHRHVEDVKRELTEKVARLERKVDLLLAALSAPAAAAAAKQHRRQQQREIRANLTGVGPHIPFGGMEGSHGAVEK